MAPAAFYGNINRIEEADNQGYDLHPKVPGPGCDQVLRRIQQPEERLRKGNQHHDHQRTDGHRQGIQGCHPFADGFIIATAVGFGNFDIAAHGKAGTDGCDHQRNLGKTAHRRNRVRADFCRQQRVQHLEYLLQRLIEGQGRAHGHQHPHRGGVQCVFPKGFILL